MSVLTLEAKLERKDSNTPWGFRMQGGKDFNSPLTIQHVNPGSLAAKCSLQVGDIILKIGNTDTEYLRHKDAQNSILESGNRLDLLIQRGGNVNYNTFDGPHIDGSNTWKSQPQAYSPSSFLPNQGSQNFNNAPRPFGNQRPVKSNYDESNLSQQASNLSLSSESKTAPGFRGGAERYSEREDIPEPTHHQSRSFKQLTNLVDEDRESNTAFNPRISASGAPSSAFGVKPSEPARPPAAAPIGPGSKPGTVKAIVSQRYNNPIGLYSNENVNTQLEGQSKFLIEDDDVPGGGTAPAPSSAYKPVSVPSFQPSHAPVAPAAIAKPWAPAPASNTPAYPFGASAPPVPTGVGATRGKKGDAAMNPAPLPAAGRIPVCSGCNIPIRGPFVTALGKCWCPDHFVCANPKCGTKLLDIGFVEEGGYLYCERDYAIHFAPHCDRCGQAVVGECVNTMQKSFHPYCFLCAQCKKPISGNKFHIEEGKYYCEADWAAMFQTMCSGCNFPIEPGDKWVEALGKNFHSECFNCSTCQINLEGQQFCAKGGRAYCKKHAH
uniref:PDZ and LIM domain protein Zasp n=1 Tax=Arion vulgaris TaxID=1028688 RepID=A0A0B7ACP1_9EUPU